MTPLGKALQEAIQEMNIKGDLKDQIIEKYEKAIEKQFEDLSMNSHKTNNSSRFKLTADCKFYNNIYDVWKFNIKKFSVNLEDKHIRDQSCIMMTIPHGDYQIRPGASSNKKRLDKLKSKSKKSGR
jgi:hypothetical protein